MYIVYYTQVNNPKYLITLQIVEKYDLNSFTSISKWTDGKGSIELLKQIAIHIILIFVYAEPDLGIVTPKC